MTSSHPWSLAWRLPLFIVVFLLCFAALQAAALFSPLRPQIEAVIHGAFNPVGLLTTEAINVASALVAILVMTRIERRNLKDYYLALDPRAFGQLAAGALFGVLFAGLIYGLVWTEGRFRIDGLALSGWVIAQYGLLWLAANFLVAVFEESVFRGYLQSTLTRSMGFWPAALIISAVFGLFHHLLTSGVTWAGACSSTAAGLLYCFCVWRTGTIWMAVGLHAAADFIETFVLSPSQGGVTAGNMLFHSALHGSPWLTGGTAGPEASINGAVVYLIILVGAIAVFRRGESLRPMPA